MTDTGTRELADGRPSYRLVRREDVELADALPGHSSGLTTCRLVGGALGSTHMALTLVSLVDGDAYEHLPPFGRSFYVLAAEPAVNPGPPRRPRRPGAPAPSPARGSR